MVSTVPRAPGDGRCRREGRRQRSPRRSRRATVGVLTPERAAVVSGANLARWALDLELGALLRLGRGEDLSGGRERESILATTLEAVLGAVYLEAGLDGVRRIVARLAGW